MIAKCDHQHAKGVRTPGKSPFHQCLGQYLGYVFRPHRREVLDLVPAGRAAILSTKGAAWRESLYFESSGQGFTLNRGQLRVIKIIVPASDYKPARKKR